MQRPGWMDGEEPILRQEAGRLARAWLADRKTLPELCTVSERRHQPSVLEFLRAHRR